MSYPTSYTKEDYYFIPDSIYFEDPPKAIDYYQKQPEKCSDCKCILKNVIKIPKGNKIVPEKKAIRVYTFNLDCEPSQFSELCNVCHQMKMSLKEVPIVNTLGYHPSGGCFHYFDICYHCSIRKNVTLGNFGIAQRKNPSYIESVRRVRNIMEFIPY